MLFNFGKCKCLHTGPGNTGMNYEIGGTILSKTVKEKDLGVTMKANMKVSEQCRIAASKGNQVIGMIWRNITYKEKKLIVLYFVYRVFVRKSYILVKFWSHPRTEVIQACRKLQFFLSVDKCHSHACHVISYATPTIFFVTSIDVSKKLRKSCVSHMTCYSQSSFLAL